MLGLTVNIRSMPDERYYIGCCHFTYRTDSFKKTLMRQKYDNEDMLYCMEDKIFLITGSKLMKLQCLQSNIM